MKPILFNTEMVLAILEGRKTVTRRVVKPQPEERYVPGESGCYTYHNITCGLDGLTNFAPHHPGDILYVRETWSRSMAGTYLYRATDIPFIHDGWNPSIHMPREAARIFLRVANVRVERLQDITESQAMEEGCNGKFWGTGESIGCGWDITPQDEFAGLWDSTIKPKENALYGWDANPWVWVIKFERCQKPESAP